MLTMTQSVCCVFYSLSIVLRRRASGGVKRDFRTYIRRYTSPNENFEYGYHQSNALLQFKLTLERFKSHKAARHPTNCDVIINVKLFPTVFRSIYCRMFLTLSNQTSRCKLKCIRMMYNKLFEEEEKFGNVLNSETVVHVYTINLDGDQPALPRSHFSAFFFLDK